MEVSDVVTADVPETEKKILESAIKMFSEKGFSAATTSEIAKNAGVAEGTIFRHFKTKKDILTGILIQMIKILSGSLVLDPVERILLKSDDKDIRIVLREFLLNRITLINSIFPMVRVIITESFFHQDIKEALYQNVILVGADIFTAFYAKMVKKGVIRDGIGPEAFTRTILGNMITLLVEFQLFKNKSNLDIDLEKTIDIILNGVAKEETV